MGPRTLKPFLQTLLRYVYIFPIFRHYEGSKSFPDSSISNLICQTINSCYNKYMGRNHFSRAGGPYFINDGFSKHREEEAIKPDKGFFYFILSGFGIALAAIGSFLYHL